MAETIAISSQKGGVGKTTTAYALSEAFSRMGHTCLMIDLDPQAGLTRACGIDAGGVKYTVFDPLFNGVLIKDVILKTKDNLDIIPSNLGLSLAEYRLVGHLNRERALKKVLNQLEGRYNYIVIDCPPSLGLLTINALSCSDLLIVPICADFLSYSSLESLFGVVKEIQEEINKNLKIFGVLICMYNPHTVHAQKVYEQIKNKYPLIDVTIQQRVKVKEFSERGQSPLSADPEIAQAYLKIAKEIENEHIHK